jgi:hypothetical protein
VTRLPSSGFLERIIVPRSQGKVAYRDARKTAWGDLFPHEPKKPPIRRSVVERTLIDTENGAKQSSRSGPRKDDSKDLELDDVEEVAGRQDYKTGEARARKVAKHERRKVIMPEVHQEKMRINAMHSGFEEGESTEDIANDVNDIDVSNTDDVNNLSNVEDKINSALGELPSNLDNAEGFEDRIHGEYNVDNLRARTEDENETPRKPSSQ